MDEPVYDEDLARYICLVAHRDSRCAELLNTLAAGGAVALDHSSPGLPGLVFISAEQVRWLASGGREGHQ